MKRVLSLSLVVLLVAAGVWGYFYVQSRGQGQGYRLARVERGPLTAAVLATGNLNAVITVQVGSQVSGQIKELFVDFNSPVKKGQLIARIDPETFEAKVNQAQAEVDSAVATVLNQQAQVERARADVENAKAALAEGKAQTAKAQVAAVDTKRDLDRKSELFKRELIAKSDLDTSQAGYDSAVAALDATKAKEQSLAAGIGSAEAQLRVAQAQLTSTQAAVKQKQAAQRQAQVDLDHTRITAPVHGIVVSRPEGKLLPGMTANVKLVVAEKPSVLKVANASLRFRPPGEGADTAAGSRSGAAQVAGGDGQGGGPAGDSQMRERLVKALNLTPEQQVKIDPILDDMRQQMIALRSAGLPEQERQAKTQRTREAMRARVREILTPEQQTKYDEFSGSEGSRGATAGRVWVIGPDGKPKAVAVRLGVTDATSTEVVSGDLHEGEEVITGALGGANQPNRPSAPGGGGAPRLRL